MRFLSVCVLAGITIHCAAGSASPASLSPTSQTFKTSGLVTLYGPGSAQNCNPNFHGAVDKRGVGDITFAHFEEEGACTKVRSDDLPWALKATGLGAVKIIGFGFSELGVVCGPSDIAAKISDKGVIYFNYVPVAGGCHASGNLHTQPMLSTIP